MIAMTTSDLDRPLDVPADTKDWTWVLGRPCPECGFDARRYDPHDYGRAVRAVGQRWRGLLTTGDGHLRQRPQPDRWSTVEYGCHVRDALTIFGHRVELMVATDGAHFENWDQDATAVAERYHEADPAPVAAALVEAAEALAAEFDSVTDEAWAHTGVRSNGSVFTVESIGRYLLHDIVHHVYDVSGASAEDTLRS